MKNFKCSKLLGRADMAEHLDIVFCKNCIKQQSYYHGPDSRLGMFTYYCYANGKHVHPNDYCSEGIRKADLDEVEE